jgi:DNA-binding transcriptional ArsR family regulator
MPTKIDRHAEQFGALGHPARLSILRLVVQAGAGGMTTTALQEKLDVPWTTLSHHLTRLVHAGLVASERDGKFAIHTADYKALEALTKFLWQDCCKGGEKAKSC